MSEVMSRLAMVEKLRQLNACQSGCNGRCSECPDDVAGQAADTIERLTATLLNIQALAESGFHIDAIKLAIRCRLALSPEDADALCEHASPV